MRREAELQSLLPKEQTSESELNFLAGRIFQAVGMADWEDEKNNQEIAKLIADTTLILARFFNLEVPNFEQLDKYKRDRKGFKGYGMLSSKDDSGGNCVAVSTEYILHVDDPYEIVRITAHEIYHLYEMTRFPKRRDRMTATEGVRFRLMIDPHAERGAELFSELFTAQYKKSREEGAVEKLNEMFGVLLPPPDEIQSQPEANT